jgi:uncharacterized protein YjbI with pentapeptide repeats
MNRIIKGIFYYSGFEYIYRKAKPVTGLPTLPLWLIGIYIAFFGIASQRYENKIDIIENRSNLIFAQLGTDARKSALGRIPDVQNYPCPVKPMILNPASVLRSIFTKDTVYTEMVKLLRETIEDWKKELNGVKLRNANLEGADLREANLKGATLQNANLQKAYLMGANLDDANLEGADLRDARLDEASLKSADLRSADLRGARLRGANLEEAKLMIADLEGANFERTNLQNAKLMMAELKWTNFESASLYGVDLRGAKNLTVQQLSRLETLYRVEYIDPELKKKVEKECPQILRGASWKQWKPIRRE